MPFLALANDRVEDDCGGDQQFERRFVELQPRGDEGSKAQADRDAAEKKVEDMPAAVCLGEVGAKAIRPAVRLLEQPDRRGDIVRFGAADAVALPLISNLRC